MKALIIALCLSGCSATLPQPCKTPLPDSLTETVQPLTDVESHIEILEAHMNNIGNENICYVQYKKPCCALMSQRSFLKK